MQALLLFLNVLLLKVHTIMHVIPAINSKLSSSGIHIILMNCEGNYDATSLERTWLERWNVGTWFCPEIPVEE